MLIYAVADIHGRRDRIALIRSKILEHKSDVQVSRRLPETAKNGCKYTATTANL